MVSNRKLINQKETLGKTKLQGLFHHGEQASESNVEKKDRNIGRKPLEAIRRGVDDIDLEKGILNNHDEQHSMEKLVENIDADEENKPTRETRSSSKKGSVSSQPIKNTRKKGDYPPVALNKKVEYPRNKLKQGSNRSHNDHSGDITIESKESNSKDSLLLLPLSTPNLAITNPKSKAKMNRLLEKSPTNNQLEVVGDEIALYDQPTHSNKEFIITQEGGFILDHFGDDVDSISGSGGDGDDDIVHIPKPNAKHCLQRNYTNSGKFHHLYEPRKVTLPPRTGPFMEMWKEDELMFLSSQQKVDDNGSILLEKKNIKLKMSYCGERPSCLSNVPKCPMVPVKKAPFSCMEDFVMLVWMVRVQPIEGRRRSSKVWKWAEQHQLTQRSWDSMRNRVRFLVNYLEGVYPLPDNLAELTSQSVLFSVSSDNIITSIHWDQVEIQNKAGEEEPNQLDCSRFLQAEVEREKRRLERKLYWPFSSYFEQIVFEDNK